MLALSFLVGAFCGGALVVALFMLGYARVTREPAPAPAGHQWTNGLGETGWTITGCSGGFVDPEVLKAQSSGIVMRD